MSRRTPPATATEPEVTQADRVSILAGRIRDWSAVLSAADRACCCAARPVVTAVMPLTEERPDPVELLLCGHHYRLSREKLAAAGALVFDAAGELVTTETTTETWLVA